jgi:hypothetical protein
MAQLSALTGGGLNRFGWAPHITLTQTWSRRGPGMVPGAFLLEFFLSREHHFIRTVDFRI